jgi:hypothetical protein
MEESSSPDISHKKRVRGHSERSKESHKTRKVVLVTFAKANLQSGRCFDFAQHDKL